MKTKGILKELGYGELPDKDVTVLEQVLHKSDEKDFVPAGEYALVFPIAFVDSDCSKAGFCVCGDDGFKALRHYTKAYYGQNLTERRIDDDNYPPIHAWLKADGTMRRKFSEPRVGTELYIRGEETFYLKRDELVLVLDDFLGFWNW